MSTLAEFRNRFPEFSDADDSLVLLYLGDAALIMSTQTRWLDFYDVANLYLAAHLLYLAEGTIDGDATPTFPLKHQEVDDVTIKNAVKDADAKLDDLYSTVYGKMYVKYRRICFTGIYGV